MLRVVKIIVTKENCGCQRLRGKGEMRSYFLMGIVAILQD